MPAPITPSKLEQKKIIDDLMAQQSYNNQKQEGQVWYILPSYWFMEWKQYVSQSRSPARSVIPLINSNNNGFYSFFTYF